MALPLASFVMSLALMVKSLVLARDLRVKSLASDYVSVTPTLLVTKRSTPIFHCSHVTVRGQLAMTVLSSI